MDPLTVGTFNLQDGERIDLLPELAAQAGRIGLLMVQEGKDWHRGGKCAQFAAEHALKDAGLDRSVMTPGRGGMHTLIFWDSRRLRLLAHRNPLWEPGMGEGRRGVAEFEADGFDEVLQVKSVQWTFSSGDARLGEAQDITWLASPGLAAIIGGDFNSLWPDCPDHQEFEPDWRMLPASKRHHKTLPPGLRADGALVADRRALAVLAEAGFASAGCLAGDMTATVNEQADAGQGGRIDHILLSPLLAPCVLPATYRVYVSAVGDEASDHRLATVGLDLGRAPGLPGTAA